MLVKLSWWKFRKLTDKESTESTYRTDTTISSSVVLASYVKRGGSPDSGEDVILKSILMYYLRFRPSEPHQVHATVYKL